jgi:hypothetical protein
MVEPLCDFVLLSASQATLFAVRAFALRTSSNPQVEAAPVRHTVDEHHQCGELSGFGAYTSRQ